MFVLLVMFKNFFLCCVIIVCDEFWIDFVDVMLFLQVWLFLDWVGQDFFCFRCRRFCILLYSGFVCFFFLIVMCVFCLGKFLILIFFIYVCYFERQFVILGMFVKFRCWFEIVFNVFFVLGLLFFQVSLVFFFDCVVLLFYLCLVQVGGRFEMVLCIGFFILFVEFFGLVCWWILRFCCIVI